MKKTIAVLVAFACANVALGPTVSAQSIAPRDEHRPSTHKGSWARGHRLSPSDRRRAVIIHYDRYHLTTPPRGYHWVRIGGSFLMVGLTSGLILRVVTAR